MKENTLHVACGACRAAAGNPHGKDCPESALGQRRRNEAYTLVVDGHPVTLRARFDGRVWRASWDGFGSSSDERPVGGLADNAYSNADGALANALADVLPVIRTMRGRAS